MNTVYFLGIHLKSWERVGICERMMWMCNSLSTSALCACVCLVADHQEITIIIFLTVLNIRTVLYIFVLCGLISAAERNEAELGSNEENNSQKIRLGSLFFVRVPLAKLVNQ